MTNHTITETAEYYELRIGDEIRVYGERDWSDAAQMARITGAEFTVVTVNAETDEVIRRQKVLYCG